MVKYLEEKSRVRFQIVPGYSDYYPGLAGGKPGGGRTIEASPFDVRKLRRTRAELRPLPRQARVFGRMMATAYDAHRLLDSSIPGRIRAARIFALYLLNPFRSLAKTDTRLTLGMLWRVDYGCPWPTAHPSLAEHYCGPSDCRWRPRCWRGSTEVGQGLRIRANKAVILAAGGFAHNKAMREKYQRQPITDAWT